MTLKEGMLGLEDDASELFKFKDDGTVEVCNWVSDVPLKAFRGLATACKEGRSIIASLDKEDPNANLSAGVVRP